MPSPPAASPHSRIPAPRAHGFVRPLLRTVQPIRRALNRGLVLDTDDVLAERLEGGHVALRLHPDIVRKLGL